VPSISSVTILEKYSALLLGVNNEHAWITDGTLGTHQTDFGGGFITGELNWKWLTINGGVFAKNITGWIVPLRPTIPVFRLGVNFEIRKYNYIRASFGQSFRVPSIAERFVTYQLGAISIIPNYDIKPERGFTAELGYKRSFKINKWLGYWDAVVFWTEFKDMIEFQFGQ
jgi:outer membrane receptor protein involved in Fe transport